MKKLVRKLGRTINTDGVDLKREASPSKMGSFSDLDERSLIDKFVIDSGIPTIDEAKLTGRSDLV